MPYSEEANVTMKSPQISGQSYFSKKPGEVEAKAKSEVNQSSKAFELQFGRFKGKTFKWLLVMWHGL